MKIKVYKGEKRGGGKDRVTDAGGVVDVNQVLQLNHG